MLLHTLADLGPADMRDAGVVIDLVRRGDLTSGHALLEHDRVETRARTVESGGVSGRASADDEQLALVSLLHGSSPSR